MVAIPPDPANRDPSSAISVWENYFGWFLPSLSNPTRSARGRCRAAGSLTLTRFAPNPNRVTYRVRDRARSSYRCPLAP